MSLIVDPLVIIHIFAYNQENYIARAIESVLMQETDFFFSVYIGEDGSSDGTLNICKKYAKRYPEKITIYEIEQSKKIYHKGQPTGIFNTIFLIENSKSKYIAWLDGDDYWSDKHKLQKQIRFLEQNNDFVMAFCNLNIENENNIEDIYPAYKSNLDRSDLDRFTFQSPKVSSNIYDLAKGNFIHTPGVVFRNVFIDNPLPRYLECVPIGDWPLYMFLCRFGKIRYFKEIMAVYRVHYDSRFSSKSILEREINGLGQYPPMINEGIFDDTIIKIWETHVVDKLTSILRNNLAELNEDNKVHLYKILDSTRPSLLHKTLESLASELSRCETDLENIQRSRTFRLSRSLAGIYRSVRKFPFLKSTGK